MDYEKEYKKRLDDARYWHDVSEGDIPAVLEEIFPELRESKDEKIRKRIILCLEECVHSDIIRDYEKEECLAWLEKQGKQKPKKKELKKINSYCQEHCKGYQETGKCFVDGGCNAKREAEKIENTSPLLSDFFNSEYERGKADALKCIEWSEEDEKNLAQCIEAIDACYKWDSMIDWLKSLRSRSRWKPSDEQMKALDSVIDEYDGYPEFDSLVSLKNDLKKL